MKAFVAITAAAVLATSPISIAQAQDNDDCLGRCDNEFGNRYGQCVDRYGGSVDGEYCILEVGQEYDACRASCPTESASFNQDRNDVLRYRPTEMRIATKVG